MRLLPPRRSAIASKTPGDEARRAALDDWLAAIGPDEATRLEPASDDASFRRYFRWYVGDRSYIVMDAPPPMEGCLPYIRVAGYLEAMQLGAPRVFEADLDQGFLVMSDMGDELYLDVLDADPASADVLYREAIDALLLMQQRGVAYQASLPDYDADLLEYELSLFPEWLCRQYLDIDWSDEDRAAWDELRTLLVRNALHQPQRFVHRDYHSRNLMRLRENNPGILDFQDAVEGPLSYDLVSLLKDCYIRWPRERVDAWIDYFYAGLDEATRDAVAPAVFRRHFDLMGIQRHLKAAGIFARLKIRDGKDGYIGDIPRTLAYIVELAPDYDELGDLVAMIEGRVMPALEAAG